MNCFITHKFTLIPNSFFNPQEVREIMSELFDVNEDEQLLHYNIEQLKATLIYALPKELEAIKKEQEIQENNYPLALNLIESIQKIKEYNKVVFHYSKERAIVHIAISRGNSLQLVNTYNATNFNSALYFLFLAIKQTIINSHQTILYTLSNISSEEETLLKSYFKGIERVNEDSKATII